MTDLKRKKGESFESFLRRFNKSLLKSRKLNEVRQKQHRKQKMNKTKQKAHALTGIKIKAKNDYLKKIGKLKEDTKSKW